MVACAQASHQIDDLVKSHATVLRDSLNDEPLPENSGDNDLSAVVLSNAWDNSGPAAVGSDLGSMPISPLSSGSTVDPNRRGAVLSMSEGSGQWTKMRMVVDEYMRKQEAYEKSIRGRLSALSQYIVSSVTFQVRVSRKKKKKI